MVIIWIEIYRFLSPFVLDGDGGNIKIKVPGKMNLFLPAWTEIVLDQRLEIIEARDEGCTGSIPCDGCTSVSVGLRRVRRVIGIQSNIAEKLFTNETPLSGNVPLLHQEGGTG